MEEKLRSILRRIHWSLTLKAIIFATSWFLLPAWLFFIVALYMYVVPRFRSMTFIFPFAVLMFFAISEAPSLLGALLFSVLFYLLLGVKELGFIDKRTPYEALILSLSFLAYTQFFSRFVAWGSIGVFFYAFAVSFMFFLLCRGFLRYAVFNKEDGATRRGLLGAGIIAFFVWELLLTVVFLPLNFLYQSALLFIITAVLFDLVLDYATSELVRGKLLINFSVFFTFLVIILGSVRWAL
jgi:hypothetical protein